MEPPWEAGKKVYINGTGHMTKMAAMLIFGKNLKKSNRPRYQVSVYRTIGPLVICIVSLIFQDATNLLKRSSPNYDKQSSLFPDRETGRKLYKTCMPV